MTMRDSAGRVSAPDRESGAYLRRAGRVSVPDRESGAYLRRAGRVSAPDRESGAYLRRAGRDLALCALALSLFAALSFPLVGCVEEPHQEAIPRPAAGGISLPSLDGLGLTKVGSPGDGPAGTEKWLGKITVDIPAEGEPRVSRAGEASRWRGLALPRDEGSGPMPHVYPKGIAVSVGESGAVRVSGITMKDLAAFGSWIRDRVKRSPGRAVLLDAHRSTRFAEVLPVMAVMVERGIYFSFVTPPHDPARNPPAELRRRLKELTGGPRKEGGPLPNVCLRIRADAKAAYGAVQDVMMEAVRAWVWRLSFVGLLGGREVEIGETFASPGKPPAEAVRVYCPFPGGPGRYGFRTGGARRRAALRYGGSSKSEAAVDRALAWLARTQEPGGHWDAKMHGGAENMDAGVTGLALLAFLGAGHAERKGLPKYQETVRKAVKWIIGRQDGRGCIGKGSPVGPGYHHAICGLALAEAFGMTKVARTGVAAQKAVEYSINVHQEPYSGWRYLPKQKADMSVTGWFVQQLASARLAGLRVDRGGLEGAAAFLEMCTKQGHEKGRVSYQPTRPATPTMTAIGMYCRLVTGWEPGDPILVGGAKHLMDNLPRWEGGGRNFYYWYYGGLAMFQMGGRHWKAWNASVRDMLVQRQRRGAPDVDGSWGPAGASCAKGGRVYSTAMGALCLETYYRYVVRERPVSQPPPPEPVGPGRTPISGLSDDFFRKLRQESDTRTKR